MSQYERYDETCTHYDATRVPGGVEVLLGCFASTGKALSELSVLDAGCGTGAYSAAIAGAVGHIDLLDVSDGMLAAARRNLSHDEHAGRVTFHCGRIDSMPFEDARLDAVMCNQVLHHLENGDDPSWPVHRRVLSEVCRVLRPGGVAVLNLCSHTQIERGFWFYDLIPEAAEQVVTRLVALDLLEEMAWEIGLVPSGRFVQLDGTLQGDAYVDPRGPFEQSWRAGDSIWALVTPERLEQALEVLRSMDRDGTLNAYVEARDARRLEVGQYTFVQLRKPE